VLAEVLEEAGALERSGGALKEQVTATL
jgi:hypothetical protein